MPAILIILPIGSLLLALASLALLSSQARKFKKEYADIMARQNVSEAQREVMRARIDEVEAQFKPLRARLGEKNAQVRELAAVVADLRGTVG
jgi:uncharacterized coiled-coil DUF342 family protein